MSRKRIRREEESVSPAADQDHRDCGGYASVEEINSFPIETVPTVHE